MSDLFLTKGMRVRAQWVEAYQTCLAGMQPKVGATLHNVIGMVRHVRAAVADPTDILLYVEPEGSEEGTLCTKCGVKEIEVKPKHLVQVF